MWLFKNKEPKVSIKHHESPKKALEGNIKFECTGDLFNDFFIALRFAVRV